MVKVKPTTMSDDDMVRFLRKINYKQFPSKTIRCRNFANYEPLRTSLKEELGHVDWDQVYNTSNVNQYTCLHQYLEKAFEKRAPTINKKIKGKLWLNSNLKAEMNNRDKLEKSQKKPE